jgi:hypothetical protein
MDALSFFRPPEMDLGMRLRIYESLKAIRQGKPEEDSDAATPRRLAGMANPTLQGDGFLLDGVSATKWFASLDLPIVYPADVQAKASELLAAAFGPSADFACVVRETVSIPPHTSMLIWTTSFYIRLEAISNLKVSILMALIAELLTGNPWVSVTASVVTALWDNIRWLTNEELEVVKAMQMVSAGRVYTTWLALDDIVSALPAEGDRQTYLVLLASMKSRGILEEGAGMWRALR